MDEALHVIDLAAKTGKKIGREGDGPGEFRLLQQFYRAPGDTPPLYDVLDGGAKLACQLELPAKRNVVGFGAGVVYLARVDDDDHHILSARRGSP